MHEEDDVRKALESVRARQDRAERAARLPWWVYALTFAASAVLGAANDFLNLTGAKFLAAVALVLLALMFVAGLLGRNTAPLSRMRGVQPRTDVSPRSCAVLMVALGACLALLLTYGQRLASAMADAVGLRDYPNSVLGMVFGVVFTALFALSRFVLTAARKRSAR